MDVRREVANERARADIANEALKTKSEADHAIQIKEREDRIKLLAENKAQLEKDMLELRAKLTDEENRRKAKEALQRSKVIASGMSGRVEQAKEPSPEERQAADNAHNEIIKAPDAATKERIVSGLTPKAREHLQANYPSDLSYKKLGAPEQLRLDSSKSTLSLIKEIRGIVKQRPNIIGPAIGRVAGFKGVVGVQDKDTSKLEGLLTSLFVNEASLYGTGRATKTLLDTIKEGGMARLPQLASQFEGRLKATEDAARINYKSISGEDYKDVDEDKDFKDLKITPIKR